MTSKKANVINARMRQPRLYIQGIFIYLPAPNAVIRTPSSQRWLPIPATPTHSPVRVARNINDFKTLFAGQSYTRSLIAEILTIFLEPICALVRRWRNWSHTELHSWPSSNPTPVQSGRELPKRRLSVSIAQPLIVLLLFTLILGQQLLSLGHKSDLAIAANNSAHTPWFFLLTLVLWLAFERLVQPGTRRFVLCAGMASLLAIGLEAVQVFTSRDASLADMARNLLGGAAGLCLIAAMNNGLRGRRGRFVALAVLSAALLISGLMPLAHYYWLRAQREALAPHLLRFEHPGQVSFARPSGVWKIVHAPPDWTEYAGKNVALVTLSEPRQYPGLTLRAPLQDWRGYEWLTLIAYLPEANPLPFYVRVATFNESGIESTAEVYLVPGENQIHLPLQQIAPTASGGPAGVDDFFLFTDYTNRDKQVYLGALFLE